MQPLAPQLGGRVSPASFHRRGSGGLRKSCSSTCWGNFGTEPCFSVSSVSPHLQSLIYSHISLSFSVSFRSRAVSLPMDNWGLGLKASGHFILFFLPSPAHSFYGGPSRPSSPPSQPVPSDRNGKALLIPQDVSPSPFRLHISSFKKDFPEFFSEVRRWLNGLGSSANGKVAEFEKIHNISTPALFYRKQRR